MKGHGSDYCEFLSTETVIYFHIFKKDYFSINLSCFFVINLYVFVKAFQTISMLW